MTRCVNTLSITTLETNTVLICLCWHSVPRCWTWNFKQVYLLYCRVCFLSLYKFLHFIIITVFFNSPQEVSTPAAAREELWTPIGRLRGSGGTPNMAFWWLRVPAADHSSTRANGPITEWRGEDADACTANHMDAHLQMYFFPFLGFVYTNIAGLN